MMKMTAKSNLEKCKIFTSKSLLITLTGALLEGLFGGLLGDFAENCHNTAAAISG